VKGSLKVQHGAGGKILKSLETFLTEALQFDQVEIFPLKVDVKKNGGKERSSWKVEVSRFK